LLEIFVELDLRLLLEGLVDRMFVVAELDSVLVNVLQDNISTLFDRNEVSTVLTLVGRLRMGFPSTSDDFWRLSMTALRRI
jgi:hypothetical protein